MTQVSNPTALPLAAAIDREVQRGIQHPIVSVVGSVTITDLDRTVLVAAVGGPAVVTLPSAVGLAGMRFEVQKVDATANTVTITPVLAQTINGLPTFVLQQQNDTIMLVSDGANWFGLAGTSASLVRSREQHAFGRAVAVPAGGTLQLFGPGNTTSGIRMIRSGLITGGSIQVNVVDASRAYELQIRVNGTSVAVVPLAIGVIGNQVTTFSVQVVAGDVITAFLVRTSGTGASTFTQELGVVEVAI